MENEPIPDPDPMVTDVLMDTPITEDIVRKTIKDINPNKSQGPDLVHPKLIHECREQIVNPLTKIYRKSLDEGKLPIEWKKANVSVIFKAGSKTKVENYRPISVTSICCRMMEKIIRNAVVQHLESNELLSKYQHGFRKGRSCVTQLLECIDEWSEAVDNNHEIDIIYLDFKAAFDKVPHKRLLKKVWNIGIQGKLFVWIKDFLENRFQRVLINGSSSTWKRVTSGVPQGSVLGPVLFLIFINDLPDAMDCALKLFADDTKIYNVIKSHEDEEKLQGDIFNACDWASKWQMIFNIKKCKTMHIGNNEASEYFMKDNDKKVHKITQVEQEKDLGVIFDPKLDFSKHVHTKVNLANRNLGLINKNFTFMDKDMFLKLYKALVRPHLEYATVIWSPRYKKESIAVENVQRRATRILRSLKGSSYSERLVQLGLPTLEYRRTRSDVIEVYKIINHLEIVSEDLLNIRQERVTRGHKHKLYKKRVLRQRTSHTFSHRVVDVWNALPPNVVEAPSLNSFKARLNRHWVGHNKFNAKCYSPY